ncbi:MAG: succinate dehydrogenase assembly factor 4 [Gammaproteobacteria bacterium]
MSIPPPEVPRPEASRPHETGGPTGPEPTRYGDWERGGRCIDF